MLHFLAEHTLLTQAAAGFLALVLALSIAWIVMRSRPAGYRPRHDSPLEAKTSPWYVPQHAREEHHARHAAAEPGPGTALGQTPDGELQLVGDEPTRELIGASA